MEIGRSGQKESVTVGGSDAFLYQYFLNLLS